MKQLLIILAGLLLFSAFIIEKPKSKPGKKPVPDETRWVDSVFNSLTPDQRLAQLFMVAAYSNRDMKHVKEIRELVNTHGIGGLIWMQGGPVRQGKLAGYYQTQAKVPLLYSIDGEWGLSMRLDSTPRYPKQMTLGAIQNDSLIYYMGRQIARECKRIGLHVNFAPVADVNNNPANPVIGMRSFGENKYKVAQKAYMYMKGLQDENILANGKHFPGHGDTDSDSHKTLPLINQSKERIDSLELYPFRYLFERGLGSIMVAHLFVPALDTTKNRASTLSPVIVNDLLKKQMGFKGLVFTDALNMKGVAKFYPPGVVDVMALNAGCDIMLFSENVPKAMEEVKKAIKEGTLTQNDIDERCRKLLKVKYWCGLYNKQEVVTRNLVQDLNSDASYELSEKLAAGAITILKNDNNFLPLKSMDSMKVAEISFGIEEENSLYSSLRNHAYVEHIGLKHDAKPEEVNEAFIKIRESDMAIIQVNKATLKADNFYGIGSQTMKLIDSIARFKPTVLVLLANPYLLNSMADLAPYKAIIMGYEYLPSLLRASANAMLGIQKVDGKLPVSTKWFPAGTGIVQEALPFNEIAQAQKAFDLKKYAAIDSIALLGIKEKAYPGCQIVALKDGQVIYQKSFGRYTYNHDSKPVDNGTIYDLASVTKIAASALSLMKLQGEQKFDYTKRLGDYLPELKGTDKDMLIEDVLTHQAGLQAWIPFYLKTLDKKNRYKQGIYDKKPSDLYPTRVARRLYIVKGYNDTIYKRIIESKLETPGKYLYSDLGYYFMQKIIQQQTGMDENQYVKEVYAKMGLGLTYLPLKYFSILQVTPTENDTKFRKQIVHGHVHDPGAALMGGIAGHAGLFGTALDVAKLMQMYMNNGEYNGMRILDSNVVKDYTRCHFCPKNRRGLCFEKPEVDKSKDSPVVSDCSPESFGHTGFTGTFAWADPKNKLIVVFLSNRVYPDVDPNKLTKLGIRGKIHKAFYEAVK